MIEPANWMAMVLIVLKVFFRAVPGNLNLVSRSFIEGVCVVPLALVVMTRRGATGHPQAIMLLMNS